MKKQTLRAKAVKLLAQSRYTLENSPAMALLVNFAAQNSGIEPANYGLGKGAANYGPGQWRQAYTAFTAEQRSISADWRRFVQAFHVAAAEGVTDGVLIAVAPHAFSGRLEWKDGQWDYCVGQYFPTEYRAAAATLLEHAIRETRKARPAQKAIVGTIAELKALNERNGGCWFGRGEMRFFGTRIESNIVAPHYFITSEQPPHGSRKFSIRSFDDEGSVETVGDFCAYDSKAEAMTALRAHIREQLAEPATA